MAIVACVPVDTPSLPVSVTLLPIATDRTAATIPNAQVAPARTVGVAARRGGPLGAYRVIMMVIVTAVPVDTTSPAGSVLFPCTVTDRIAATIPNA